MSKPVDMAALVERAEAKRLLWVPLEPGKRVQVRRPDVVEGITLRAERGMKLHEAFAAKAVAWEGITERDLLVDEGSDAALDFSPEAWRLLWGDRPNWLIAVAQAVKGALEQYEKQREAAAKNSKPS